MTLALAYVCIWLRKVKNCIDTEIEGIQSDVHQIDLQCSTN